MPRQPAPCPRNSPRSKRPCPAGNWFLALALAAVRNLDRALRSVLGIVEFCDCTICILRIAFRRARLELELHDGTRIKKSDELVELHFWNEHLPSVKDCGSPFGWAVRFRSQMRLSLDLLATHAVEHPDFRNVKAFYARMVLPIDGRWDKCTSVAKDLGFDLRRLPRGPLERVHDSLENLLIYALVWAFHPGKLQRRRAKLERVHWWISRKDLIARIADAPFSRTLAPHCEVEYLFRCLGPGAAAQLSESSGIASPFSRPG